MLQYVFLTIMFPSFLRRLSLYLFIYLFEHRTDRASADRDRTALDSIRAAPKAGPTASVAPGDILGPLLATYRQRVVENRSAWGALFRTITLPATSLISFASPPTGGRLRSQGDEGGINGAEADEASGTDAADAAAAGNGADGAEASSSVSSSSSDDDDDDDDDDGSDASPASSNLSIADRMKILRVMVRLAQEELRKAQCQLDHAATALEEHTIRTDLFVSGQERVIEQCRHSLSSDQDKLVRRQLKQSVKDSKKKIAKARASTAVLETAVQRKETDMAVIVEKIAVSERGIAALDAVRQAQESAAQYAPPPAVRREEDDDGSFVTDRPIGDEDSVDSPMEVDSYVVLSLNDRASPGSVIDENAMREFLAGQDAIRAQQAREETAARRQAELDGADPWDFNPSLSTPTNNSNPGGGSADVTPQTRNGGSARSPASPPNGRRRSPPQMVSQAIARLGSAVRRLGPNNPSPPSAGGPPAPVAVADANYAVTVGEDLTTDTSLLPNLDMIAAILSDFHYPDGMSATDFLEAMGPHLIIRALFSAMHTVNQKKLNMAMEKILAALNVSDYARSNVAKEILGQAMAKGYGAVYLPNQQEYLDSGIHSEIHIFTKCRLSDHYRKNRASGINAWRPVHDPNMQRDGENVGIPVPTQLAQTTARVLVLLGAFSGDFHSDPINFDVDPVKKFFVLKTEGEGGEEV